MKHLLFYPAFLVKGEQSLYGAVDLLVVGQFGTAADVSAVATGSQMMHMVTVVITGLAMGTTILLGQSMGGRKEKLAGEIKGSSICFFLLVAIGVTVLMLGIVEPFTSLMHAPEEAFSKTMGYVRICSCGTIFIVAYNVLGIIKKKGLPFPFSRKNIKFNRKINGRILKVGLPVALQDGLVNISFLVINAIVNSLGVVPSAGVGVAEKVCAFIMLVPSSFSQSMSAFVAICDRMG